MASLLVSAVSKWDGKALKGASKDVSAFDKSLAKMGKTLAGAFAAQKILGYASASIKAFAAEDKALRSLNVQLANTGNAMAGPQVDQFLTRMQDTTAVLKESLIPAFRTILTATGDVTKSQNALSLALDVSAGTGKDLQTVSVALAKGYSGQTTALSRLGAGIDKSVLKTGDMVQITDLLQKKFKGQALEAASGYSGEIAKLGIAAHEASLIIGKGLLDSINNLSTAKGIDDITTKFKGFAQAIADVSLGLSNLIKKVTGLFGGASLGDILSNTIGASISAGPLGALMRSGAKTRNAQVGGGARTSTTLSQFNAQVKTSTNILATDNKTKLDALKLAGDQKALDELKKKMDVERTDLAYALTQATDDETRARIAAKIAILDGDAKTAASLNNLVSGQVLAADQMLLLASAAASAAAMLNYLKSGSGSGGAVYGTGSTPGNTSITPTPVVPPTNTGTAAAIPTSAQYASAYSGQAGGIASNLPTVSVNVSAGMIGSKEEVTQYIQNSLQDMLRYGWSTNYAGGL